MYKRQEEINARIEAEGDRIVMRDPARDADRQIEQIEEMLYMGIDALVAVSYTHLGMADL